MESNTCLCCCSVNEQHVLCIINKTTTVIQRFVHDYPGEPVPEQTFTHSHLSWLSTILCRRPPSAMIYSIPNLCAWQFFIEPLSKSSMVYLLVWKPPLHIPHISLPNHYLLFAIHAYTITTSFQGDHSPKSRGKWKKSGETEISFIIQCNFYVDIYFYFILVSFNV